MGYFGKVARFSNRARCPRRQASAAATAAAGEGPLSPRCWRESGSWLTLAGTLVLSAGSADSSQQLPPREGYRPILLRCQRSGHRSYGYRFKSLWGSWGSRTSIMPRRRTTCRLPMRKCPSRILIPIPRWRGVRGSTCRGSIRRPRTMSRSRRLSSSAERGARTDVARGQLARPRRSSRISCAPSAGLPRRRTLMPCTRSRCSRASGRRPMSWTGW